MNSHSDHYHSIQGNSLFPAIEKVNYLVYFC